jgi:hypothetical protein
MQPEDIKLLLDKYYEGDTTLAEERLLKQYFNSPSVTPDLIAHAPLFKYKEVRKTDAAPMLPDDLFKEDVVVQTDHNHTVYGEAATHLVQLPVQKEGRASYTWSTWVMRIAAGLALLVLGFGLGAGYKSTQPVAPVAGTYTETSSGEVGTAHQVLLSSHMGNASASERLQAIHEASLNQEWDEVVIHRLISIMNFDDNVNVRLAASEALMHFGDEPTVRQAMVNSLSIQADPAMQLALIDMLVALKERKAVGALQQITLNDDTMEVVKQKAAQGMGKLL